MQPPFALPAALTIYTVGGLYPQCCAWMGANTQPALPVQAQAVREVDAAGVQLLLSWCGTLASARRTLLLVEPSDALVAACAMLGVDGLVRPAAPVQEGAHQ
jgi:ABC-type transporter Mla MlaB component